MFVEVEVGVGANRSVIPLPASAINYAPFGNSVYVVTDTKDKDGKPYKMVRQQFVKTEGSRGDQVGVISGLNPGDEVLVFEPFYGYHVSTLKSMRVKLLTVPCSARKCSSTEHSR